MKRVELLGQFVAIVVLAGVFGCGAMLAGTVGCGGPREEGPGAATYAVDVPVAGVPYARNADVPLPLVAF